MEALQLSVLDLPPQNVLGILPRFKIAVSGKDADAIAKFAETIGEIRLDQLPDELAGNGKSGKHLQANLPVEIEIGDRTGSNGEYADQFEIGDRVVDHSPPHPHAKPKGFGQVMKIEGGFIYVRWDNAPTWHKYGKLFINQDKWLAKVDIDATVSGICDDIADIPETTLKPRRHGTIETYQVKGRNGKEYEYQRYVYLDAKGVYRHHHIPQKQTEKITAMWTRGKSAKEICVAIGKKYLGKDSA